jgi:ferric-dicitrate binding protein FerR (iron transport regulator)
MTSNDCNHWANLSDRDALEEELSLEERRFLAAHHRACSACAAEARVFEEMKRCLDENLTNISVGGKGGQASQSYRRRWAMGSAILAAAALGVLVFASAFPGKVSDDEKNSNALRADAAERVTASPLSGSNAVELVMTSGEVATSRDGQTAGAALVSGDRIETKQGRACLTSGSGAVLCLERDSAIKVDTAGRGLTLEKGLLFCKQQTDSQRPFMVATKWAKIQGWGASFVVGYLESGQAFLRLHGGRMHMELDGGQKHEADGQRAFTIADKWEQVPADSEVFESDQAFFQSMKARSTARLSPIEIHSEPPSSEVKWDGQLVGMTPVTMMVESGEHNLEISLDGYVTLNRTFSVEGAERISQTFVLASEQMRSARPGEAIKSTEGPRELLLRAQTLRGKGDYSGAALAYESLIRSYPESGEGRASLVSLGELSLSQLGAPHRALSHFERYLAGGGSLSQEAGYGRIRALRALGREEEARAWGRKFVEKYPDSAQAVSLRRWL